MKDDYNLDKIADVIFSSMSGEDHSTEFIKIMQQYIDDIFNHPNFFVKAPRMSDIFTSDVRGLLSEIGSNEVTPYKIGICYEANSLRIMGRDVCNEVKSNIKGTTNILIVTTKWEYKHFEDAINELAMAHKNSNYDTPRLCIVFIQPNGALHIPIHFYIDKAIEEMINGDNTKNK